MRAIRQHAFGGPEELRLEEVPNPHPGAGEVRVRVASAGVHLIDAAIRRGERTGPFPPPQLPMTPGREVAGIVDEVGDTVDTTWVGRRVVADLGAASGGYAELALAPADVLHEVPRGLADDAAVAMVGTGRTAMSVLEVAAATSADVVLVTAAASGIGTILVQALRSIGATVIGVARGCAKVSVIERLGAAAAIDYGVPGWEDRTRSSVDGRAITLALDGVGGTIGRSALELLAPGGRLVMFGTASGAPTELSATDLYARGITIAPAIGTRLLQRPGGLRPLEERALASAASGEVTPYVGQVFPLADAAAAHHAIETRATTGKVVLHADGAANSTEHPDREPR